MAALAPSDTYVDVSTGGTPLLVKDTTSEGTNTPQPVVLSRKERRKAAATKRGLNPRR